MTTSTFHRLKLFFQAYIVDHGFLRAIIPNRHKISTEHYPATYRSSHPSGNQVASLAKRHNLKSILSLRMPNAKGPYQLEKDACNLFNVKLKHVEISSRKMPSVAAIMQIKEHLEQLPYPLLIHCKSGADRAGITSVLYKHFIEKQPINEAIKQLSLKYGHLKWAETGRLDFFFESYLNYAQKHPQVSFTEWLNNEYDPETLEKSFKTNRFANILVNKLLRRE